MAGIDLNENYVVDTVGKKVGVLLPIEEYMRLMDLLEEFESERAYDEAIAEIGTAIPFEQAVAEIEGART